METNKNYFENRGKQIIKMANIIASKFKGEEKTEEQEIIESLRKAEREWKDKEEYFQYVTEPDLIDYAIYQLEASKIK